MLAWAGTINQRDHTKHQISRTNGCPPDFSVLTADECAARICALTLNLGNNHSSSEGGNCLLDLRLVYV